MSEENKIVELNDEKIDKAKGGGEWKSFDDTCEHYVPRYGDNYERICDNCIYGDDAWGPVKRVVMCTYRHSADH